MTTTQPKVNTLRPGHKQIIRGNEYEFSHIDPDGHPVWIYRANGYQGYFVDKAIKETTKLSALK